jgi:hypothetical protein
MFPNEPMFARLEVKKYWLSSRIVLSANQPILHSDATTIPIIGGLHGRILELSLVGIKAESGRAAESGFVGVTIIHLRAELVKAGGRVARGQDISGNVQEGIATTHTDPANVKIH